MEAGLQKVIDGRFDGTGKKYVARFRFANFSQEKEDDGVRITFSWKFKLVGPDGEPLMLLEEDTTGDKVVAAGVPLDI